MQVCPLRKRLLAVTALLTKRPDPISKRSSDGLR